jgi:hypothetical protein
MIRSIAEVAAYHRPVKSAPTILAILSLPAAAIGYFVTRAILLSLSLPGGVADLLLLVVPLFVAGLCMVPFVIPALDRQAKRDLEAHRAATGVTEADPAKDRHKPTG